MTKTWLFSTVAVLMMLGGIETAQASDTSVRDAKLLFSAFECSLYASSSGMNEETDRLFKVGYDAGERLLNAMKAGTVTPEDRNQMPIAILLELQGPNAEFILGEIYASITSTAYRDMTTDMDTITAQDGSLQTAVNLVTDSNEVTLRAGANYRSGNCSLL